MLTVSPPRADESSDSRDPVIQQTPVFGRSLSKGGEPQPQTIFDTTPSESKNTTRLQQIEGDAFHTPLADHGSEERVAGWDLQTIGDESVNNEVRGNEVRYNKRTPNLDRIAKFFKSNKEPGDDNLLSKFDVSEDSDTPVSKRSDHSLVSPEPGKAVLDLNPDLEAALGNTKPMSANGYKNGDFIDYSRSGLSADANGNLKAEGKASGKQSFLGEDNRLRHHMPGHHLVLSDEDGSGANQVKETKVFSKEDKECAGSMIQRLPEVSNSNGNAHSDDGLNAAGERSTDFSRIDDTAEGIPEMWILRPNNAGVFNSNKSTQVINTTEMQADTKESFTQPNDDEDTSFIKNLNELPTQIIASQSETVKQRDEINSEVMNGEIGSSTQIIQSPEQAVTNSLETPKTFPKINFEPIMEVPETSSPSKSREINLQRNSSPSPADRDRGKSDFATQINGLEERVRLQISRKSDSLPSGDENSEPEAPSVRPGAIVVLSDIELTQELPEIEEDATEGNSGTFNEACQEKRNGNHIRTARKRREVETIELVVEEENRSSKPSPTKKIRRSSRFRRGSSRDDPETEKIDTLTVKDQAFNITRTKVDSNSNPDQSKKAGLSTEVRYHDEQYLSKEDIKFEDAVWCQYSLDYRYYPGRLLSHEEESDSCWVYFETGKSLIKNEDIYYLDTRVGDTVTVAGKKYRVVGLESKETDEATIRCVRGYDTVHLKRKKKSGSLAQKTVIRSLASVSLDLNEWTKRPKIILENGSHAKAKAYQALQHPIRGRKNNASSSPRKIKTTAHREQISRPVYKEESDEEINLTEQKEVTDVHGSLNLALGNFETLGQRNNGEHKIFEKCLFVLTGLDEDRQELSNVIESQGGEILQLGFSELFEYELLESEDSKCTLYALQLKWKEKVKEIDYKFACLITRRHLRSLKYLETLALGWPTLHWKFIRECLQRGKICFESINQYLLPSGESYRLSFEPSTKNGVIKSNNIYQFYSKLLKGLMLRAQLNAMREQMTDYTVIIHGQSELDHFVRFVLACLGVTRVYQTNGKAMTSQEEIGQLNQKLDDLLEENGSLKVIIYVNKTNGISSALLDDMRDQISSTHRNAVANGLDFHVEAKEWLIQTIINGAAGFDE